MMGDWIEKGLYEKAGYDIYKSLPDYRAKWGIRGAASVSQLCFLMGLIKEYRFADDTRVNKVIEVGTYHGISALYMLRAGIMCNEKYHQYDIEVENSDFYGEVVRHELNLDQIKHWSFMNGKTTFDIESILSKDEQIDMIFIDGAHAHPYPLLDLIMLLPYMRKDALVCFHDVEFYNLPGELGGGYMYTGWRGQKYLNQCVENNSLKPCGDQSLGVLKLPENVNELYDNLVEIAGQAIVESFFNYTQKNEYWGGGRLGLTSEGLALRLLPFMRNHYPSSFVMRFWENLSGELRAYQKHWVYLRHMNRLLCSYWQGIEVLQKRVDELELSPFRHYVEEKIPNGVRLAIFGAGFVGRQVYKSLTSSKHYKVVAWVDNGYEHFGFEITAPGCLSNIEVDYVLVSVDSEQMRDEIIMQLQNMGYDNSKIMWIPNVIK